MPVDVKQFRADKPFLFFHPRHPDQHDDLRGAHGLSAAIGRAAYRRRVVGFAKSPRPPGGQGALAGPAACPYARLVSTPFPTMFEQGRYLRLMNMASFEGAPTVDEARDELERCARAEPDPCDAVRSLFRERDWRAHVIASTALAMGLARPRLRGAAWACLDDGSWASPQLVAALSLVDRHFVQEARARVEGCRMEDAKKLGALRAALARVDPAESSRRAEHWVVTLIHEMHAQDPSRVQEKSELDIGTEVTERWLSRVLADPGFQRRLVDLR